MSEHKTLEDRLDDIVLVSFVTSLFAGALVFLGTAVRFLRRSFS